MMPKSYYGIMDDGEVKSLSVIRLYGMGVSANGALEINQSLHLIISYLLKGEQRELGV